MLTLTLGGMAGEGQPARGALAGVECGGSVIRGGVTIRYGRGDVTKREREGEEGREKGENE